MEAWQEPLNIPYSPHFREQYYGAVADLFDATWLEQADGSHPLQELWRKRDPFSVIRICRLGRDICTLINRGDAEQDRYLRAMAGEAKRAPGQMDDLLFELHFAMLFNPAQGIIGRLAPNHQGGYDVTAALPDGKVIYFSCKRLHESYKQEQFEGAAAGLASRMVALAADHDQHKIAGLIMSTPVISNAAIRDEEYVDPNELLSIWEELCIERGTLPGWVHREIYLPGSTSAVKFMLGLGPHRSTGDDAVSAAYEVCIASKMPDVDYVRFVDKYREAVAGLKRAARSGAVPPADATTAWAVAMEIPGALSMKELIDIMELEWKDGNHSEIAALLGTCATPGIYGWPALGYNVVEEFPILFNLESSTSFASFLGDAGLNILVEGEYTQDELVMGFNLPHGRLEIPHGYSYVASQEYRIEEGTAGTDFSRFAEVLIDKPMPALDMENCQVWSGETLRSFRGDGA